MTCIGTWNVKEEAVERSGNKSLLENVTSGVLALRDQKGFGQCLEYRKSEQGQILGISTNACSIGGKTGTRTNQLTFQGSCQEALVDKKAVSQAKMGKEIHLKLMLTVMLAII